VKTNKKFTVCRIAVFLAAVVFALLSGCKSKEEKMQALFDGLTLAAPLKAYGDVNPICLQRFGADPWGLVYKDRVYVYMTGDTFSLSSGTNLLPDLSNLGPNTYSNINTIRVVSSSDLVNWTEHPEIKAAGITGGGKAGDKLMGSCRDL